MIATEMYGMIPSAKTEKRSSAPPENRLIHPNRVDFAASKNEASACPSIPGVGTATPIRYTASIAAVNNSRRRNSGMREAFETPSSIQLCAFQQLHSAARGGDFLARSRRKGVRLDRQFGLQLAVSEHLHHLSLRHKAALRHRRRIDRLAFGEDRQPRKIDQRVALAARRILQQAAKPALGQPPLERHLTAFIAGRRVPAAARTLALVPAARSLAMARTNSAANPLAALLRAGGRFQRAQVHRLAPLALSLLLLALDLNQVRDLADHPFHHRRALEFALPANARKPQPPERFPHAPVGADRAAHESHMYGFGHLLHSRIFRPLAGARARGRA